MTLLELINLMKKQLRLMIFLPVACAVAVGAYAFLGMPDTYLATTSLYVLTEQSDSNSNLSTDLTASQLVANDVTSLLNSSRVQKQVAEELGLKDLSDYDISVESTTTSRIIELGVSGTDPKQAAAIANALAEGTAEVSSEVMGVDAVNIVDPAVAPTAPSGPSRMLYIAVAAMGGLFLAVAIVVVGDMMNTRVRSAEDVEELIDVPVIGRISLVKSGN